MKIVVVKVGSSVIAPQGKLDSRLIRSLVKDILGVEEKGYRVVLVSSGAIACGLSLLGHKKRPQDIHTLMAISSCGQIALMDAFNSSFKKYKRRCAQVLLTWDDFDVRVRFMNIRKTISKLLAMDIIPVINENDVVSYEEIRWGDNDYLSALVADAVGAQQLIMLSDVEGLLDKDRLVEVVWQIDEAVESLIKKQTKTHTAGGMATKLEAATKANLSGIKAVIAHGRARAVVGRIIAGEKVGTVFMPSKDVEKSRKRWIHSKPIKGCVTIDDGAVEALLSRGKSLLAVGIIETTGSFKKGDAVTVVDARGAVLGCGLVNYSSDQLQAQTKKFEKAVIHRDNFVKVAKGWSYHPHRRFSAKGNKS